MYWFWDNKIVLVYVVIYLNYIKIIGIWRYMIFLWYKMYIFDLIIYKVYIVVILNLFKIVIFKGGIFF